MAMYYSIGAPRDCEPIYVSCSKKGKILLIGLGHIIGPRVDYCIHQPRNFGQIRQRDHFSWVNSNRPGQYIRFHSPESFPTCVCSLPQFALPELAAVLARAYKTTVSFFLMGFS